jgi:hypothetical protein
MSNTTMMFCPRTLTSLWIGQGDIIYTGDGAIMTLLGEFLSCNSCHPLYFLSDVRMTSIVVDILPAISPSKEYGSSSSHFKIVEFTGEDSIQQVDKEIYEPLEQYLNNYFL